MKRILFISYDFPYPTNTGGKMRAYNLIRYANSNLKIHLVSFIRSDFKKSYIKQVREMGVKSITLFKRRKVSDIRNLKNILSKNSSIFKSLYYSKSTEKEILALIKRLKIDIVHFESYYTAFYMSDRIRKLGVKQIFGTENIEHFLYQDYAKNSNLLKRLLLDFEIKKIEKEEINFLKFCDLPISVTEDEAAFIKKVTQKKCEVIENGVDLSYFQYKAPQSSVKNKLLFIGNFTYFPNKDAINYFYKEVFKKINPKIELLIIGKDVQKLKFLHDKRVKTISFVENITDAYNQADIMISPIRIGGGTNFKILEAMASGIPIIADPTRIESLQLVNGKHLLFARNAEEFREKINLLLHNYDLRVKLSEQAKQVVEKKYSWEKIGSKLNKIWQKI